MIQASGQVSITGRTHTFTKVSLSPVDYERMAKGFYIFTGLVQLLFIGVIV